MAKTTLSIIKADIGSVGGHVAPSPELLGTVEGKLREDGQGILEDWYVGYTGDDIALLMAHFRGAANEEVHRLAWEVFLAGTETAKSQGLYGAGQDLLADAFSGNVRGMGPAVAELEFEARENEPFLMFAADKTEPGAYNLPLYLSFCDPMFCSGLILSPSMHQGFQFTIMDVSSTEADRVITLNAPEEIYDIATLLRDNARFVVESIVSRANGEPLVSVSTTRLRNIAGKYVGKDDPVLLVRTQKIAPATGEIVAPYSIGHFVGGCMRGSHNLPLFPIKKNSGVAFFDGPSLVSCLGFCVKNGKLTQPIDIFDHPFWDHVRDHLTQKTLEIRRQGFSGNAMLDYSELEYGGITHTMEKLEERFQTR